MTSSKDVSTAGQEVYPIRTVSTLTGVNSITLRAWERRYGLIRPTRTPTGHRVYTRTDIDTVHRVLALMEEGVAIGHMREALTVVEEPAPQTSDAGPWTQARANMVAAISQFDEARLEVLYNDLLALHTIERVTYALLLPLLAELGERWTAEHPGGIAEEHFFGVFLRNKIGARLHHRSRIAQGPKLLAACLPGEHHEVGLLLFALAAHEYGYRVVLFGANMPLEQLSYVARRAQAQGIVLSGSIEPGSKLFSDELPALVREAAIPVIVGGQTSVRHRDELVSAGATPLGVDIGTGLRLLQSLIPTLEGKR
jgi:DNA-binding transcriptional MerR regulator/methylmalonyl-CoA mutase cobalamin-binding subunit